ncbi:hypothetical protein TL16_g06680, partial [Triparma laevis f. inornata]
IIKKSNFIALASPASSYTTAQTFLQTVKTLHPKARHHCHAYHGSSPQTERSSDDGEPTGTAGQPILSAIKKNDLTNVVIVVVRYSGGIKLGAGGLIRAYGGIASTCLIEAEKEVMVIKKELTLKVPSKYIGEVYQLISKHDGMKTEEEKYVGDEVEFTVEVEEERVDGFKEELGDRLSGNI